MQMNLLSYEQAPCDSKKMDQVSKNNIPSISNPKHNTSKTDISTKDTLTSTPNSQIRPGYMDQFPKIDANSISTQPCESQKMDAITKPGANPSTYPCPLPSPRMITNSEHLTTSHSNKLNDDKSNHFVTNHYRGIGNNTHSDSLESSSAPLKPHTGGDVRWDAINSISFKDSSLGLSHFRLLKRLGSGDIGNVYLVELRGTNTYFAMKFMDKGSLASRNKLLRAQTEREILGLLDHPFLPTLYSYFETEQFYCLVMEFCSGGNLHSLRQKQPNKYFTEEAARLVLCTMYSMLLIFFIMLKSIISLMNYGVSSTLT